MFVWVRRMCRPADQKEAGKRRLILVATTGYQCSKDPTFSSQAAIDACSFRHYPQLMKRRRVGWRGGVELNEAQGL
jgi:hypothetical protein